MIARSFVSTDFRTKRFSAFGVRLRGWQAAQQSTSLLMRPRRLSLWTALSSHLAAREVTTVLRQTVRRASRFSSRLTAGGVVSNCWSHFASRVRATSGSATMSEISDYWFRMTELGDKQSPANNAQRSPPAGGMHESREPACPAALIPSSRRGALHFHSLFIQSLFADASAAPRRQRPAGTRWPARVQFPTGR